MSVRIALSASATGLFSYTRRSTVMGLWSLYAIQSGMRTHRDSFDRVFS